MFQCSPLALATGSQASVLPAPSVPVEIRVRVAPSFGDFGLIDVGA